MELWLAEYWPAKDVCVLIPRTYDKWDFADVAKLKILRWGDDLDDPGGPDIITRSLEEGCMRVGVRRLCDDGSRGRERI